MIARLSRLRKTKRSPILRLPRPDAIIRHIKPPRCCYSRGHGRPNREATMSDCTTKRCTKCGEIKPLEAFDKSTKWADGRRGRCKLCRSLTRKSAPTTAPAPDRLKQCGICHTHKPAIEFSPNGESSDGRHSNCRECERARAREWKARNKDKIRTYEQQHREHLTQLRRAWKDRNRDRYMEHRRKNWSSEKGRLYNRMRAQRRRVRKTLAASGPSVTQAQVQELMARQSKCYYCRKPFNDTRTPTLDHVIPLAKGGPHDISNIVLACKHCNSSKSDRIVRLL
jgi:HNH endonuclease